MLVFIGNMFDKILVSVCEELNNAYRWSLEHECVGNKVFFCFCAKWRMGDYPELVAELCFVLSGNGEKLGYLEKVVTYVGGEEWRVVESPLESGWLDENDLEMCVGMFAYMYTEWTKGCDGISMIGKLSDERIDELVDRCGDMVERVYGARDPREDVVMMVKDELFKFGFRFIRGGCYKRKLGISI